MVQMNKKIKRYNKQKDFKVKIKYVRKGDELKKNYCHTLSICSKQTQGLVSIMTKRQPLL